MNISIKTKFNVGDGIWLLFKNQPINAKIERIQLFEMDFGTKEPENRNIPFSKRIGRYILEDDGKSPSYCYESEAFATKKELAKSIMK